MGIFAAGAERENPFAIHRRLIYFQPGNMKARWINHTSSPELPIVGRTVIATFWPGRYYLVLTTQVDSSTPLRVFLRSVALQVPYENVPHERDIYVTQIFNCKQAGFSQSRREVPL